MTQSIDYQGSSVNYQYDGRKERILKTVGSTVTPYLRGTYYYPLTTKTGSAQSSVTRFNVYGPTGLVAVVDNGTTYFVVKDHLGSTRVVLNISSTAISWYDYTPYGNIWRSTISGEDVAYKFTGQEFDPELGLYNFRARTYDGTLGIFYASDPGHQGFSPYMYCGGNPIIYIDKNGRWAFWDDATAMLMGGFLNLTINAIEDHVHTWAEGIGYFLTGAASGEAFLYGGPAASGAVLGAGNSMTAQAGQNGWRNINWGQVAFSTGVGGVSGYVGNQVGNWVNSNVGGVILNSNYIASPVIKQAIGQAAGGAVTGYGLGFVGGFIQTGSLSAANEAGISNAELGAAVGFVNGTISGIKYAQDNNLNIWSGSPQNSVVIGQGMSTRVIPAATDIGSTTINSDWPANISGYDGYGSTAEGTQFNGSYIDLKMQQGATFFDMGPTNGNSPYYNLETARLFFNNYENVYNLKPIYTGDAIKLYLFGR
jgi:RHS repeat-associated protein